MAKAKMTEASEMESPMEEKMEGAAGEKKEMGKLKAKKVAKKKKVRKARYHA